MTLRTTLMALGALMLCTSTPALAEGGVHEHDGFALRLSGGFGYMKASTEETMYDTKVDTTLTGTGPIMSIAPGFTIGDNLTINADIFGARVSDPELEMKGGGESETMDLKGDGTLYAIGVGITYYLQPSNLYIAGSVGKAYFKFEPEEGEEIEDEGFAVNVMVGKEWWVADQWGIGVAGQFIYADIEDTSTMIGGIAFTATMN
jgi:hypothetical protein